jgi:PAS domain-containing protein
MARTHAAVVADPEGVIRYWSEDARLLFGYEAEEAIGQSLDLIVPPAFRRRGLRGGVLRASGLGRSLRPDRAALSAGGGLGAP